MEKEMKISIDISEQNESTAYPWWMIIKPSQNFKVNEQGICNIAFMITGPFFSREEAELELSTRRYDYGPNAKVWCGRGYRTGSYRKAIDENNPAKRTK